MTCCSSSPCRYEYTVDPETEIYRAHYFCLLFSSGLDQNGQEEQDIKG